VANTSFDKNHTLYVKGIAILCLLLHHIVGSDPSIPIAFSIDNVSQILGATCKICVSLFTILSGYGITKSWLQKKNLYNGQPNHSIFTFSLKHIWNLWKTFLIAYIFCTFLYFIQGYTFQGVYGNGWSAIWFFVKDIAGLANLIIQTPTLCGQWWFIEATFCFYLIFPLLLWIIKKGKIPAIVLCIVTYAPWMIYQWNQGWSWHTDRELFYLFSFVIGMIFAYYNAFEQVMERIREKKAKMTLAIVMSFCLIFVARAKWCLIVDPFLSTSVIALSLLLYDMAPTIQKVFCSLGKLSADIYLIHAPFILIVSKVTINSKFTRFITLTVFCAVFAAIMKQIKKHYNLN